MARLSWLHLYECSSVAVSSLDPGSVPLFGTVLVRWIPSSVLLEIVDPSDGDRERHYFGDGDSDTDTY